ncbi:nucleoside 2-deoxyribosyltransferase [Lysinibacillus sphaericus]|uniref:Nucleoside 2-deoxyribosyltransferase n=3 Tax=Lysinibacillus TaxID=400634 RepID=A0A2S0JZN0_LYSSH|nr:nucleoside 2-deoxyribosyltransferase [Lysinibacillus tabacifolii]AVK96592.1 nucleoside 2-deoxyribosyltransferase [Lysinibacillus sphaericus]TKI19834.1 nucleoside 2-deoxyribosyltransferase [Lysinibacillus sphaericus]TKI50738.1 nucleoside 2-deoxyribosyltransferase [Lysinibacillus tabacifolii]UDK99120.1 nucleoside 2-deoxyribosyltransferase [Lysinibacillus sphaericus]SUV17609.1 Nucleoside 2-deoxyribosyltransferase [Lysinibacillus sphaericus]
MKAYLANGLFSLGDRLVNERLATAIRQAIPDIELYVPQENDAINDKASYADSLAIAEADLTMLQTSDVLVAVLDGVEIDSGVAAEIGAFSMLNRPIVGVFTDVRQQGRENMMKIEALIRDGIENQFVYRNLFVIGLIKRNGVITTSIDDAVLAVQELQQ